MTAVPLTRFFGDELIELHHPAQHWASLKCFACSALQPWIASQSFCQLCSKRGGVALCTLQSLVNGAFLLARRPSVASHKTGKAVLCKQDQQPYTASWTTTIGREAICGVSQDGQRTAVKAALTSPYPAAGTVQLCGLRRHLSQTAEPASAAQPARQLCAHPICHPHIP